MMAANAKRVAFVQIAVDTLGHLLGLLVTPANEQDRTQVQELARAGSADYGGNGKNCLCRSGIHRRASSQKMQQQRAFN